MKKENLAIDFDSTLAQYPKFVGVSNIPYPPEEGAKEAVDKLKKYFLIIVFSVRAREEAGRKAIAEWMKKHEIHYDDITAEKPEAVLYVDDRGLQFKNWKQALKDIANFEHKDLKKSKKDNNHVNKSKRAE